MANIAEIEQWEAGVYQLETTDPVEGGPDGVDNLPHKALANRTLYLKSRIDALSAALGTYTAQQIIDAAVDKVTNGASAAMDTLAELEAFVNQLDAFISSNDTDISAIVSSLATKANINGDKSQPFNVAAATQPTEAVRLDQFRYLFSTSGEYELPGGLLLKTGITGGADLDTIYYPVAFPNETLTVMVTENSISTSTTGAIVSIGVAQDSYTPASFKLRCTGSTTFTYFAIGR